MDFKKRNENSRPGRARSGEGRDSGRGYRSRSSQEHRERRDEGSFRKRKPFGNSDDENTRNERFERKQERSDKFEKRPFRKDFRYERSDKREYSSDEKPFKRERNERRQFSSDKSFRNNRSDRDQFSSRRPFRKREDERFSSDRNPYKRDRDNRTDRSEREERNGSFKKSYNSENKPYQRKSNSSRRLRDTIENRFKGRGDKRRERNQNVSVSPENSDGLIRLNRFIAASGICSRREADDLIKAGLVTVNGKVISEMGVKVSPKDEVKYNGELIKSEKLVYILLNKPKDYVTTSKDPYAKQTVLDLLKGAGPERVFPVGRLDRNTTGVLLLTNDGDLTKKLTHPSFNKKKIYQVTLDKNLKPEHFNAIAEGIELEDGFIKVDALDYIYPEDKKQVGVEIHSGKNHIVRRIFEHFGYRVSKLDRVYFAGLTKKNLKRGEWRYLTSQEIGMLKMGSYE